MAAAAAGRALADLQSQDLGFADVALKQSQGRQNTPLSNVLPALPMALPSAFAVFAHVRRTLTVI